MSQFQSRMAFSKTKVSIITVRGFSHFHNLFHSFHGLVKKSLVDHFIVPIQPTGAEDINEEGLLQSHQQFADASMHSSALDLLSIYQDILVDEPEFGHDLFLNGAKALLSPHFIAEQVHHSAHLGVIRPEAVGGNKIFESSAILEIQVDSSRPFTKHFFQPGHCKINDAISEVIESASEVLHWTDTLHGREEWDIIAVIDILGENCTSSGICESLLELHLAWVCLVQDKVPWNLSQCNLLKL